MGVSGLVGGVRHGDFERTKLSVGRLRVLFW